MPNPLRAVVYARVSSGRQKEKSGLDVQKRECQAYAENHGFELVDFYEDSVSGAHNRRHRDGLDRMLADAESGKFSILLVHELDRLAREMFVGLGIVSMVAEHGIQLIEVSTGDRFVDEGALVGLVKLWGAGEDRKRILRRTKAGHIERAKKGFISGPAPLGYDKTPEGKLAVNPDEAALVARIFDLYVNHGYHYDSLAALLNAEGIPTKRAKANEKGDNKFQGANLWQRSTIKCVLKNPVYKGTAIYGKTRGRVPDGREYKKSEKRPLTKGYLETAIKNRDILPHEQIEIPVPAIVDADLWQQTQELMTERAGRLASRMRATKYKYLFESIVRCSYCGRLMMRTTIEQTRKTPPYKVYLPYYVCRNVENKCPNVHVHHRMNKVDFAIIEQLVPYLEDPNKVTASLSAAVSAKKRDHANLLSTLRTNEARLAEVQAQMKKVKEAFYAGAITLEEFTQDRQQREAEAERLTAELAKAREQSEVLEADDDAEKVAKVAEYFAQLKNYSDPDLKWLVAITQDPNTLLFLLEEGRSGYEGKELPLIFKLAQNLIKSVKLDRESNIVEFLVRIPTTPPDGGAGGGSGDGNYRAKRKCITSPSFTS